MQDKELVSAFFLIAAVVMFHTAWSTKRGGEKWWFMLKRNPTVPKDTAYGSIPIGVGCLIVVVGILIDNRSLFSLGFFGGIAVAFVFMVWKPDWLKPTWLLWLEDHYDPKLVERMLQKGDIPPSTQKDLETWVEKMTWEDEA
jgi:hypothetical protein